jgi:hypothetical protein
MPTTLAGRLAWAAALLWLASWFLPAVEEIAGWQAFRYALSSL